MSIDKAQSKAALAANVRSMLKTLEATGTLPGATKEDMIKARAKGIAAAFEKGGKK